MSALPVLFAFLAATTAPPPEAHLELASVRCEGSTVATFAGHITARAPGQVQYRFLRSGEAPTPLQTLVFRGPATHPVSLRWILPQARSGWAALQVVYPAPVTTPQVPFEAPCGPRPLALLASLQRLRDGSLEARVTANQACAVQLLLRGASGQTGDPLALTLTGPGSRTLPLRWTCGPEAWVELEVAGAVTVRSNRVTLGP